jgi:flagellar hook-associated protein 3 FlgL
MRITTNTIIRNYGIGLNKSSTNLYKARNTVLSGRNFNTMADNIGSSVKAFQLRREYSRTGDQLENLEEAYSRLQSVESSALQINTMAQQVKQNILTGASDTSKDQRSILATNLREIQKSMVLSANSTYGDKFVLNGANTREVPFVLSDDGKSLTYRGIDVNTGDMDKLKELSQESLYVDLGFGLQEDATGKLITSSAFDMSTPGINLLGYGNDANGNSKNIITLIGQLATELEKDTFDKDKFQELSLAYEDSYKGLINSITQLGTKSNYLSNTKSHLEDVEATLNEKIVDLEDVDLAAAITQFSWAQYAYNAALKVGNSVLSSSFIDFMN